MPLDAPPALSSALADRYELRDTLGRGGMATVYLARDRKHQRDVALKVLRPELAATLGAERFLKEIEIVAQLTHPHILPLHDSGEAGGFVFYVMPHITGGSLRQQLCDGEPMAPQRAIEIASPVADALAYAHSLGVLHRDIKPENILFSHGHPVIADFGIARAVSSASERQLTRTGIALGTPGYMSPEQAAGFAVLDERTDVYSLAVVIYEMIVGEIPGHWPSEESVRRGQFLDSPPLHRSRLASAGATIEQALVRGLAVQQGQRTGSIEDLIAQLRGIATERRKYRTTEVNEIVKRASEMELSIPTAGAMTIGGVEEIAREVGIAPELVRSAAKAVAAHTGEVAAPAESPRMSRVLGGPRRVYFETAIAGELSDADFPIVVAEIRRTLGSAGLVNQLGRSFSWVMAPTPKRREFEVAVTARAGVTRIYVSENMTSLNEHVFLPIRIAMGLIGSRVTAAIVGGALHSEWLLPLAIPAWLGATYFVARTAYRGESLSRQREAAGLSDRLAKLIADLIQETPRLPGAPR